MGPSTKAVLGYGRTRDHMRRPPESKLYRVPAVRINARTKPRACVVRRSMRPRLTASGREACKSHQHPFVNLGVVVE